MVMRDDYNEKSLIQREIISKVVPFLNQGMEAFSADMSHIDLAPIIVADYGSSSGANSSYAVSMIIDGLRAKYGFERTNSVLVVHNDLPSNNWHELFNYSYNSPDSYLNKHRGVKCLAGGVSFYEQVLPGNSLHFGFSNTSLHWLSELPVKLQATCLANAGSPEERQKFAEQAAKDWSSFLQTRATELVSGGILVLNVPSEDEGITTATHGIYEAASELRDDGMVTDQELLDFNFRFWSRSLDEVMEPFSNGRNSFGLEAVSAIKIDSQKNPFYREYLLTNNVDKFWEDLAGMWSAALEPSFSDALSETRTSEEKKTICTKLWQKYADQMKAKFTPDQISNTWGNIWIVLKKSNPQAIESRNGFPMSGPTMSWPVQWNAMTEPASIYPPMPYPRSMPWPIQFPPMFLSTALPLHPAHSLAPMYGYRLPNMGSTFIPYA